MQTKTDAFLLPDKIKLKDFYLYGQTLKPIEMVLTGAFKLIIFQLYPFASKILFGVNPKQLNDGCFDLRLVNPEETSVVIHRLQSTQNTKSQVTIITHYLRGLVADTIKQPDVRVQLAINLILESKGSISVKTLTEQLYTTERTLLRQFLAYAGISPKQFSKIIQFQTSLTQISQDSLTKLTDIAYENGYADQSHFIRDFRKYAGLKPTAIKKKK